MIYSLLLVLAGAQSGGATIPGHLSATDPNVFIPNCSEEAPGPHGVRAHTNYAIYVGPPQLHDDDPLLALRGGPRLRMSGPAGLHPSDLRAAYADNGVGSGVVCIVDAYNLPTALNDFNAYATQFGLPTETSTDVTAATNKVFQVVYASGRKPSSDSGWGLEMALDIEMAHAMAPNAKVVLVEASDSSFDGLFQAVGAAAKVAGAREISMSWGGGEFSGENSYDGAFQGIRQIPFAASGDWGAGDIYPAASPNVVSCGGTSLYMNGGGYGHEVGWDGAGGGPSSYESRPIYQQVISGIVGSHRGVPDIAAVADPNTGVTIYDTYGDSGWDTVGGTSVATPLLAGLHNASLPLALHVDVWSWVYGHTGGFHDITSGNNGYPCKTGWDYVTGWGTPRIGSSL